MAGHSFVVSLPSKTVSKITRSIAEGSGFWINEEDLFNFRICKGNFALSLIAGAFIAYCNFAVELEETGDGETTFTLTRNSPWWTGLIGVGRVKSAARKIVDEIVEELQDSGGTVSAQKEI